MSSIKNLFSIFYFSPPINNRNFINLTVAPPGPPPFSRCASPSLVGLRLKDGFRVFKGFPSASWKNKNQLTFLGNRVYSSYLLPLHLAMHEMPFDDVLPVVLIPCFLLRLAEVAKDKVVERPGFPTLQYFFYFFKQVAYFPLACLLGRIAWIASPAPSPPASPAVPCSAGWRRTSGSRRCQGASWEKRVENTKKIYGQNCNYTSSLLFTRD